MLAAILGFILKLAGSSVVGKVLTHLENKANSETERLRIASMVAVNDANNQASVIKTAMGFKIFWVAWSIAAVPLSVWFGWGVLDSTIGAGSVLPNVASLPPQLKEYADVVWSNIFYTGALGAVAQTAHTGIQAIIRLLIKK